MNHPAPSQPHVADGMNRQCALTFEAQAQIGRLELDVSLTIDHQPLILLGPNGAGKTSLLCLMLGILPMRRGRLTIGDTTLYDSERQIDVPLEERRIAYVPQDYALFPHLTVQGNVAFAVDSALAHLPSTRRRELVAQALGGLGLSALGKRLVATLSGGEKQRVALARALCISPRALLLDEPLAALDVCSRHEVREFLAQYLRKLALPTIVVTHDFDDARLLGDHCLVLEGGRVTQQGTFDDLIRDPRTPFVASFVAARH